jgi:hypothetical protein
MSFLLSIVAPLSSLAVFAFDAGVAFSDALRSGKLSATSATHLFGGSTLLIVSSLQCRLALADVAMRQRSDERADRLHVNLVNVLSILSHLGVARSLLAVRGGANSTSSSSRALVHAVAASLLAVDFCVHLECAALTLFSEWQRVEAVHNDDEPVDAGHDNEYEEL